ncbi:MAG: methylenetetrahydrofolate reductase, partial [Candidatus Brocadiales bacterium]|nr:methylenetetrahydrofolate reductase [Candidatus Brocadiales bacterium]
IIQMTCRDRNRIAIQSDLLGAAALGAKNLLCLTGDHQKFGDHPMAKGVFDIDSIQLIQMVKILRDEKKFQSGQELKVSEPKFFIGAAENPFADPFKFRAIRLAKKITAGADFIQTQIIYNVKKFKEWMKMVTDMGLHEKAFILAGVAPLKSAGMAKHMKHNVPGMDVPDEVMNRMTAASAAKKGKEEGIKICLEVIEQVRAIKGISGVHIMAVEWEEAVPEIVKQARLHPRPT